MLQLLVFSLVFSLLAASSLAQPNILDYVGTGEASYKDGPLKQSTLNQPYGLAFDHKGNLIIVDSTNHRIRQVVNNEVKTLAGTTREFDVYGLPLGGYIDAANDQAMFNLPKYAVVDKDGSIYVSDSNNHVIRKISGGKVYTYAGTGEAGYANGDRTKAKFNRPAGLALDREGNLYVADTLNHVIRKITPNGTVSTFAGLQQADGSYRDGLTSQARFNEPNDLAFDEKGNLYVSDTGNHLIRVISQGTVKTFAGKPTEMNQETGYMAGGYRNGDKEDALFLYPKGLYYAEGVLFVADSLNHRVRAILADGNVINLVGQSSAGDLTGVVEKAQLFHPVDIAYQDGKLYISTLYTNKIKVLDVDLNNIYGIRNIEDIMDGIEFRPIEGDEVQVWFDYEPIEFSAESPIIDDGGVYLPVRQLFEQWGAIVEWLGESQEISLKKEDWHVVFKLNLEAMKLISGRTFVELDELSELTGFLVEWVEDYRAVIIDSK